jgi:hypothetical protein
MSLSNVRYNLPFSLGIPNIPAGEDVPLQIKNSIGDIYQAIQQIAFILHTQVGIGQRLKFDWDALPYFQTLWQASQTRIYLQAAEEINYGRAVNLFDSGNGILQVRLASASSNARPAHGFCSTSTGIPAGSFGEFILNLGLLTGLGGLVTGTRYFLSTTPGFISSVPALAAGNIEQALGLAVSPSALLFNISFAFFQH